jgi:phosphoribosyl 1,2-cyclic phosphate phosphodiesterase
MKLSFLGTGTSYGVPYVGCDCAVCRSDDPRDRRLRASVLVETATTRLLVDTTPDLRAQLLRADVASLSAILWTHAHNDHIIGLDDIRPLSDRCGYVPGYGDAHTIAHLHRVFDYVFLPGREHGGFPRAMAHVVTPRQTFAVGDISVTAIPIRHGRRDILAYRFESGGSVLVYATDCSHIPDASWELMRGADVLVLDALRHREHPAHFSVAQALEAVAQLQPRRTFFTHIAHDLAHEETNEALPAGVKLAYDMLSVEL